MKAVGLFKQTYKFDSMCVDAGSICVMDKSFLQKNGGKVPTRKDLSQVIKLPKAGNYLVTLKVKNTWLGTVKQSEVVVSTGSLVVGDACYCFKGDKWSSFLNKTDMLKDFQAQGFKRGTGGDGGFDIEVTVKQI